MVTRTVVPDGSFSVMCMVPSLSSTRASVVRVALGNGLVERDE
jgi:hypothetical protein